MKGVPEPSPANTRDENASGENELPPIRFAKAEVPLPAAKRSPDNPTYATIRQS
jgi:hypothetical protein